MVNLQVGNCNSLLLPTFTRGELQRHKLELQNSVLIGANSWFEFVSHVRITDDEDSHCDSYADEYADEYS